MLPTMPATTTAPMTGAILFTLSHGLMVLAIYQVQLFHPQTTPPFASVIHYFYRAAAPTIQQVIPGLSLELHRLNRALQLCRILKSSTIQPGSKPSAWLLPT